MRILSVATAAVGLLACVGSVSAAPKATFKGVVAPTRSHDVRKQLDVPSTVRGGAILAPGRTMTWQTALKYKAGLLAETGILLGVLGAAKRLQRKYALDLDATKIIDFSVWALIIFGSDGIIGLLRKLQVRAGFAQPRITLAQAQQSWYQHLSKPSWTPAEWVFPAVWIPLKILQVFAARIVWIKTGRDVLSAPIVLFALHQAFGDLWNTAFFRERYIAGGLSIIYQFSAVLLAATYSFYKNDNLAGTLLFPTCAWLVVASSLNLSIYKKNKPLV